MTESSQIPASAKRVCFVFDSDSQYYACRSLVPYFNSAGWEIHFVVVGLWTLPAPTSGIAKLLNVMTIDELWKLKEVRECDAIGAYLPGSKLQVVWYLVDESFKKAGRRPLLFTGYNGLVLKSFEDGFSWRTGCDLIALNSLEDFEKADSFMEHSTVPKSAMMPIIGIDRRNKFLDTSGNERVTPPKQIVFAEQVLFPRDRREKYYLYSHFIRVALANPEWRIVIKPRTVPGGETFHRQDEHISVFLQKHFNLPPNLILSYDPLDQVLGESAALLTISSTAFFDALGQGVPAFTLSDFGISNNYGTHFFHGSGCTLCLGDTNELSHELLNRRPAKEWLEFKGFSPDFSQMSIVTGLEEMLADGKATRALGQRDLEQRIMSQEATLPREHVKSSVRWGAYWGNSPMDPVRKTKVSWKKSIARFRRRLIWLCKNGFKLPDNPTLPDA